MSKKTDLVRKAEEAASAPQRSAKPDAGPVKLDFKVGDKLDATVRPNPERPVGFVAVPLIPGKLPNMFVLEGELPPSFDPPGTVQIKVTGISERRATAWAEVVGPDKVLEEAKMAYAEALTESQEYWSQGLIGQENIVPFQVENEEFDKIKRGGRNGEISEVDLLPQDKTKLPINLRIINIPRGWVLPSGLERVPLKVTQVEVSPDKKRVIGQAYAVYADLKQPPTAEELAKIEAERAAQEAERVAKEQERQEKLADLNKQVETVDRSIASANLMMFSLTNAKELIREGKFWVKKDWSMETEDSDTAYFELFLEVPDGWSPDKLVYDGDDKVLIILTKAGIRGDKLVVYAHFKDFDPKEKITSVSKPDLGKSSKTFEGVKMLATLRPLLGTTDLLAVEQLLKDLDTADLAQAQKFSRRLAMVKEIETIIKTAIKNIVTNVDLMERDEGAVGRVIKLREELKRVGVEVKRLEEQIELAKAVVSPETSARRKKYEAQIAWCRQQPKTDDKGKVLSFSDGSPYMVEHAVEERRLNAVVAMNDIEDIAELKRLLAEQQAVLGMRDELLDHGIPPFKQDRPLLAIEYTEDFWVAERLIPEYERRLAEVERSQAGLPPSPPPPPPPIDSGTPLPVKVGDPAPVVKATEPRPDRPETTPSQQFVWLQERGYKLGSEVILSASARQQLGEDLFSPGEEFPEQVKITRVDVITNEIDLQTPDGAEVTISLSYVYELVRETQDLVDTLAAKGVVTQAALELDNTGVDVLLKAQLSPWLEANPGKSLPHQVRVGWVDLTQGKMVVTGDPALKLGKVLVSIEDLAANLEHVKVSVGGGVLPAPGVEVGLATAEPAPELEIPQGMEDAVVKQIWKYTGVPSTVLPKGGTFIILKVDYTAAELEIQTAKEVFEASRAKPPRRPVSWKVTAEQWRRLPRTFESGPTPPKRRLVETVVSAPKPAPAVVEVEEVEVEEDETHPGSTQSMNKLGDIIRSQAFLDGLKKVAIPSGGIFDMVVRAGSKLVDGEPLAKARQQLEQLIARSGDVLAANERLVVKAVEVSDTVPGANELKAELIEAEKEYRAAEQRLVGELLTQINQVVAGKATAKTLDVAQRQLAQLTQAVDVLGQVNTRVRQKLEPKPRKIGP